MAKQDVELQFRLIDGVTKSLTAIQQGVSGLGASLVKLNSAADLAGKGIDLVVSAAKGIGGAVAGAADFEEAMRRISIRTNATADEQVALQQAVIAAADSIGATADQSAAALFALAKDGGTATQAIDSLGAVLAYAKLQGGEAADSATALGGILDSFGPRAGTVGQVADALTAVSAAAGTEAKTLEAALGGLGVAAQQANLSFNDTVAILGQLATRNIEGADASKRLATILDQFQDPASKAGKALSDAGLAGADFSVILQTLSTDSAAATAVLDSLGRKPQEALTALLEGGGGSLGKFNTIVKDTAGATDAAAKALDGTFNDSLKRVQAQISILSDVAAGPILKPLADGLATVAARLSEFAKSPAFDAIIGQITSLATNATDDLVKFVEGFNFDSALATLSAFVTSAQVLFDALVVAAKAAAFTINLIREAIVPLAEFAAQVQIDGEKLAGTIRGDLNSAVAEFAANAQRLGISLEGTGLAAKATAAGIADTATGATAAAGAIGGLGIAAESAAPILDTFGGAVGSLGGNFKSVSESQKGLQDALTETFVRLQQAQQAYAKLGEGTAADAAWADVVRLSNSVADLRKQLDSTKSSTTELAGAFKDLGIKSQAALVESAQKGADAFRAVADAARQGQATQEDVTRAFEVYAQRLAETATLADASTQAQIAQQIELAGHVAGVSQAVIDVATQTLKSADVAESSNARSAAAWDKTAAAVSNVAQNVDKAAASASDFANASDDFARVQAGADQVTASAERMSITFHGLNERLRAALYDATSRLSGGALARELNNIAWAAYEASAATDRQTASSDRLSPALQANELLLRLLEERFGIAGARIEQLTQLRVRENEVRLRGIELAQREIEQADTQIAQAQTQIGLAGGFGPSRSNPATTPAGATAAPASAAASKGVAQAVTINIQGLPSDRAGWRQAVEEFVLPEIQRLGKLSR